jgi:hypothetical protein
MGWLPVISLGHGAAYGTPSVAQKFKIKSAHSILPQESHPNMQPNQPAYEGDSAPQGLSQGLSLGSWQLVRPQPPSSRCTYALQQIPTTPNSPHKLDDGTVAMNFDDWLLATTSPTNQTFEEPTSLGDDFWSELFMSITPLPSETQSSAVPVPSDAQPSLGPGE